MVVISRYPEQQLKDKYRDTYGHYPTWLGAGVGKSSENGYFNLLESLDNVAESTAAGIPVIGGTLAAFMHAIAQGVYDITAPIVYKDFAKQGDDIIEQFNKAVVDTQARIDAAVSDMRSRIDSEIVEPLRYRLNSELKPAVDDLQSRIGAIQSAADRATSEVDAIKGQVVGLQSNIKMEAAYMNRLNERVNTLTSSLDAKMKDIENRMATVNNTLQNFEKRIRDLEEQVKGGIKIPDFLRMNP